jgi:hypothetical protein
MKRLLYDSASSLVNSPSIFFRYMYRRERRKGRKCIVPIFFEVLISQAIWVTGEQRALILRHIVFISFYISLLILYALSPGSSVFIINKKKSVTFLLPEEKEMCLWFKRETKPFPSTSTSALFSFCRQWSEMNQTQSITSPSNASL